MTPLAEAAKGGTCQLSLFSIHWDQFDISSRDESVKIPQTFGAISRLDYNGCLYKANELFPEPVLVGGDFHGKVL